MRAARCWPSSSPSSCSATPRSVGSSGAIFMTLMTLPVTGLIALHALQQEKVLDGLTARARSRPARRRRARRPRVDPRATAGTAPGIRSAPPEHAGDGRERDRGARGRPGRVLGDLAQRAGGAAPRRQQPRPPRAGRDGRARRPGTGMPGGVAEPVPGGTAGADPTVPRQRRARRVPEAAEPPERCVRRGLRSRLDHGPHGGRHPRDGPRGLDRRRRRHRRPADARQAGGHAARPAPHHGRDPAPGRDRRADRALEPAHDGEPRPRAPSPARTVRPGDDRPRPLQAAQRLARPRDGRPCVAVLRAHAARLGTWTGSRCSVRRRGIRGDLPGRRVRRRRR